LKARPKVTGGKGQECTKCQKKQFGDRSGTGHKKKKRRVGGFGRQLPGQA